jgi:regulator of protease activity HflC (stomatin/prohibitin superfamily)
LPTASQGAFTRNNVLP